MNKPVKRIVIVLVVLVAVLVAADYGLAAAAEYQVSKRMRAQLGLAADPSVDIHGFPFIVQALRGDYSDITVNAVGVPARDTLRDLEVDADLHNVRVGLSDLLSGNVKQVKVDEVDGQVKVKATDVGRLLNLPDLTITPVDLDTVLGIGAQQKLDAQRPGNQTNDTEAGIELSASVNIAGEKTQINAFGVISLVNGGDIQISPKKLQATNSLVSGQIPDSILQPFLSRFTTTLTSKSLPLPFTVRATGVQVESGALVVAGTATDITLDSGTVNP